MVDLNPQLDERTFDLALNFLSTVFTLLLLLGFFTAFLNGYRALRALQVYYVHTSTLPRYLHGRPHHAFALITGASDGVGRAFAHALAARGFNLILHGRNAGKLATLVETMQAAYPSTAFRTLVADASTSHGMKTTIENMAKELETLPGPLTVLVNNVGGTGGRPANPFTPLAQHTAGDIDSLLNLNIRFATQLTRACLPLLTRPENKPALILNAGSATGRTGMPYLTIYAATKAFLSTWTESLAQEMRLEHGNGVEVMLASIGQTSGAGGHANKGNWFMPTADVVANGALDRVGSGWVCLPPTPGQALLEEVVSALPAWVVRSLLGRVARKQREERAVGTGAGAGSNEDEKED